VTPVPAVRIDLGARSYEVLIGPGALAETAARVGAATAKAAVLADETVARLHGEAARDALVAAGAVAELFTLPAGERAKELAVVERVCRELARGGWERGDAIVALGGGAATDAAGFAAAVYLRGIRWFALPTTLLAQVDAAIGGKTAVDLPEGKNLVGVFHQPAAVGCDPRFLHTLPPRELRAGLAEVVKAAWIGDAELFAALERDPPLHAGHPALPEVVRRCVAVKAKVVSADERESGPRERLNFGHTLGHAIETEARGRWLHGEAVALGMVAAVRMSVERGLCEAPLLDRLEALLERVGLPTRDPDLDPTALQARLRFDKKRRGGSPAWQLTAGLGVVTVARDLPEGAPLAAVEYLRR
jgi:3-dehydroquinate synthase